MNVYVCFLLVAFAASAGKGGIIIIGLRFNFISRYSQTANVDSEHRLSPLLFAASLRCNSCTYIADTSSDSDEMKELFDDLTNSRYNDEKCGDASDLDDSYCWSRLYQCSTAKVSMKVSFNNGKFIKVHWSCFRGGLQCRNNQILTTLLDFQKSSWAGWLQVMDI